MCRAVGTVFPCLNLEALVHALADGKSFDSLDDGFGHWSWGEYRSCNDLASGDVQKLVLVASITQWHEVEAIQLPGLLAIGRLILLIGKYIPPSGDLKIAEVQGHALDDLVGAELIAHSTLVGKCIEVESGSLSNLEDQLLGEILEWHSMEHSSGSVLDCTVVSLTSRAMLPFLCYDDIDIVRVEHGGEDNLELIVKDGWVNAEPCIIVLSRRCQMTGGAPSHSCHQ